MEEDFWKQKAAVRWVAEGERNTRFFQGYVRQKRAKSYIHSIEADGSSWTQEAQIRESAVAHFQTLFTSDRGSLWIWAEEGPTREGSEMDLGRCPFVVTWLWIRGTAVSNWPTSNFELLLPLTSGFSGRAAVGRDMEPKRKRVPSPIWAWPDSGIKSLDLSVMFKASPILEEEALEEPSVPLALCHPANGRLLLLEILLHKKSELVLGVAAVGG
ncbi:1-deoxy-D-xylulose-5-phosphate synthase [Striga asiatica]|uniref:1-deoxy-D-xylulose-5-phosphate synthase n=1 Tax=Striga asiatica TaxID=4170 RepID=A0A5A7QB54_STRAF|nr:1-deoxy-D-xylulose-5-phosphate synthase [Striga asiatica]